MNQTGTILDKIVADKKAYLAEKKRQKSQAQLEQELAGLDTSGEPSFFDALKHAGARPAIIAEVKKASPSARVLRDPFDLDEISEAYQAADNVAAISVVTENKYFQGSEDFLTFFAAHNTHKKPLLRKDFLFEPYQILESKLLGAHAYLLIASLFNESELAELVDFGLANGLEPLVEVHDQQELDKALKTKVRCIGANSRDLKTFEIDSTVHDLLGQLDDSYVRIVESGIETKRDFARAASFCDSALIGTTFMKSKDIAGALGAFK